ncbi:hypothetical protein Tco_0668558 [Tanacetum coccineum]
MFNNRVGQRIPQQAQSAFTIQQAQQPTSYHTAQQPVQAQHAAMYPAAQFQQVTNLNSGILGAAPGLYPTQPASLPSAYSTMTVQDPNMDTCASSHLNYNASNLSTIFNQRLFPYVHVGDGNSILVTNTGPYQFYLSSFALSSLIG